MVANGLGGGGSCASIIISALTDQNLVIYHLGSGGETPNLDSYINVASLIENKTTLSTTRPLNEFILVHLQL